MSSPGGYSIGSATGDPLYLYAARRTLSAKRLNTNDELNQRLKSFTLKISTVGTLYKYIRIYLYTIVTHDSVQCVFLGLIQYFRPAYKIRTM